MIKFTVPGPPVPKARARVTKTGHAYTPAKTRKYEALVAMMASQAMAGKPPFDGPVTAHITAIMPIPKSWSKGKKAGALSGFIKPTSRPDLDNIEKAILDGCEGIVYHNDSQVYKRSALKVYGDEPGVEVIFSGYYLTTPGESV